MLGDGRLKVGLGIEEMGTGNGRVYGEVGGEWLKCDMGNMVVMEGDRKERLERGRIWGSG